MSEHVHHHDHDHSHAAGSRAQSRPLAIALGITLTFLIVEVIGGIITNSLALLADAGHMLTDVASLALALFAIWLAQRPATARRSFGFYRAEVLAALVNAVSLIVVSIFIFIEAFKRFGDPPEINSTPMLVVAVLGLLANAASAWVLMRGGGHQHNLNMRGAFLHVVGDMLGSVGAIAAALVMMVSDWYLVDPLLSAGIGLLVLWNAWRLMRESVDVLLEATPAGIDTNEVASAIATESGVDGVHDLHIWTLTSGFVALSAHVHITEPMRWNATCVALTDLVRERFGILHVTLQPESGVTSAVGGCSVDGDECGCIAGLGEGFVPERHGHAH